MRPQTHTPQASRLHGIVEAPLETLESMGDRMNDGTGAYLRQALRHFEPVTVAYSEAGDEWIIEEAGQ